MGLKQKRKGKKKKRGPPVFRTPHAAILAANLEMLIAHAPEEYRENAAFARYVGLGNGTIDRIRKGTTSPTADTLAKIATKFNLQVWQLHIDGLDLAVPSMAFTEKVKGQLAAALREELTAQLTEELTEKLTEEIRGKITGELVTGLMGLTRRLPTSKQKPEEIEMHAEPLTPLLSPLLTQPSGHPQMPPYRATHNGRRHKDE